MSRRGSFLLVTTATLLLAASPAAAVVHGHDAPIGKYPENAYITFVNAFVSFQCTGTLIAPTWVLTAGHCGSVTGLAGNSPVEWPPQAIRVRVGGDTRGSGEAVTVLQAYGHPSQRLGIRYDISLLQLTAPSTKAPTKVVGAADGAAWEPGDMETIIGWGVNENGASPNRLQEAEVPITTDAYCANAYGSSFDPNTMVCAGFPQGGVDTCQGDSGGPMFGFVGGQRKIVGTTSWGEGCGEPGKPGVYARVGAAPLREWIRSLAPGGVD